MLAISFMVSSALPHATKLDYHARARASGTGLRAASTRR